MTRHISFRGFRSGADFAGGTHQGTAVRDGALAYDAPAGVVRYTDVHADRPEPRDYEWAAWLSPQVQPGFAFTELVPSWNASTPGTGWVGVEARVSVDGARWSPWYTLARWAETDAGLLRASRSGQADDAAQVKIDTLRARGEVTWTAYQLRVVLLRRRGEAAGPAVRLLSAVVSQVSPGTPAQVSPGGEAWGVELPVPPHSQQLHRGTFPQWADGGEGWCSPSSTTMVLERWGLGPDAEDQAWLPAGTPDPSVVHAARHVFDHCYGGCGNWTFNVAYAGRFGVNAFVTRLRSLTEMEALVAAGVPPVASIAFGEGELGNAGYDTAGHLLVVRGFTRDGDVVCNDPASHMVASNDEVRVVYERAAFERVWLGAPAAGVVYVIHPVDVPLPPAPDPARPSW